MTTRETPVRNAPAEKGAGARPVALSRAPLLALALLALLAGMWAGLVRIGWPWPPLLRPLPMSHGPLMVAGFMGALICLERAVALGRRWAYAGPLFAAAGAGALLVPALPAWLGPALIAAASAVLCATMIVILRLHVTYYTGVITLGALCWLVGNLLWLAGGSVPGVVLWWGAFLVFTVVGERLELSRMLRLSRAAYALFYAATALVLLALVISIAAPVAGTRLAGAAYLGLAVWLLVFDIARRRLKAGGQARYIAVALLTGFVWLGVAGLLALRYGGMTAGPFYDAVVHTLFLGFGFVMIFAHAPIVFPAVLRLPLAYTPRFYSHLVLLHAGLLLRVVGDLAVLPEARRWGALINALALLLFLVNTLTSRAPAQR